MYTGERWIKDKDDYLYLRGLVEARNAEIFAYRDAVKRYAGRDYSFDPASAEDQRDVDLIFKHGPAKDGAGLAEGDRNAQDHLRWITKRTGMVPTGATAFGGGGKSTPQSRELNTIDRRASSEGGSDTLIGGALALDRLTVPAMTLAAGRCNRSSHSWRWRAAKCFLCPERRAGLCRRSNVGGKPLPTNSKPPPTRSETDAIRATAGAAPLPSGWQAPARAIGAGKIGAAELEEIRDVYGRTLDKKQTRLYLSARAG